MVRTNYNKGVFESIARNYIREDSHWGGDLDLIKLSLDDLIKDNKDKESKVKWLDVGCGPGFHIINIAELYPETKITGVDYSSLMLTQARKRIEKLGLHNICLKKENIIENFPEGKYDLITFMNNGLGNLYKNHQNPKKLRKEVFQKISDYLKTGGYFILSVYNKGKLENNYGDNLKLSNKGNLKKGDLFIEYTNQFNKKISYYSHWFSEKELYELARDSELELVFLERRMSRFLVKYKKQERKNGS